MSSNKGRSTSLRGARRRSNPIWRLLRFTHDETHRRGFTAVEVLITTSLIGLIFAGGIAALVPMGKLLSKERKQLRVINDLNSAFIWIEKDAMLADDVWTTRWPDNLHLALAITITDYADPARPQEFIWYGCVEVGNQLYLYRDTTPPFGGSYEDATVITPLLDTNTTWPATDGFGSYTATGFYAEVSSTGNYLKIEMALRDTEAAGTGGEAVATAHERYGVMLRCRDAGG